MISHFPTFSKLDLQHRNAIEDSTSRFPPYSDFNFTSLFSYDTDGSAGVSLLNDNLVIRLPDYTSDELVYSLLGRNSIDDSISKLLELSPELKMVPEHTIVAIQHKNVYKIDEDRANFDYVYELADLARLTGRRHKKKRHKVNRVHQSFAEMLLVDHTNYIDRELRQKIEEVFSKWKGHSKQPDHELESETIAIGRLLDNSGSFNLFVTLVSVEAEPVAFSINEVLGEEYTICHFEKAAPVHHHIFSFVTHQAAEHLLAQGCSYVNWEQDLGIDGLRQSKMSYHPSHFLKKYTIYKS